MERGEVVGGSATQVEESDHFCAQANGDADVRLHPARTWNIEWRRVILDIRDYHWISACHDLAQMRCLGHRQSLFQNGLLLLRIGVTTAADHAGKTRLNEQNIGDVVGYHS